MLSIYKNFWYPQYDRNFYYNTDMMNNEPLLLGPSTEVSLLGANIRSIKWSNKYCLPPGYEWNDEGYVITAVPYPYIRVAIGRMFSFLMRKLGVKEYLRQNLIALRLLNEDVPSLVIGGRLKVALRNAGLNPDCKLIDELVEKVYALDRVPALSPSILTWRSTWFNEDCKYDTVSQVLKAENSGKIDADRDLMKIHEKYVTECVAEFTGFSRRRVDAYWKEKEWTKKDRTLFSIEEAYQELSHNSIAPTKARVAELAGVSTRTYERILKDGNEVGLMITKGTLEGTTEGVNEGVNQE